jgi:ketosteroid isomerase-like protein
MQKTRCTVLLCWMGDRSRFMTPVNVFPSTETPLRSLGPRWQEGLLYKGSLSLQTRLTLLITCCILPATFVRAAPEQSPNPVAEIQSVLREQQEAWNRGDIDGFMNGYARSPSTVFVSEDEVRRGWETVRERYRQKYSDHSKMGTLTFSDIEIMPLLADAAIVLGRWRLKRANDEPHGRFTLIFKRLPEGWRIVHDHTSAAPPPG